MVWKIEPTRFIHEMVQERVPPEQKCRSKNTTRESESGLCALSVK